MRTKRRIALAFVASIALLSQVDAAVPRYTLIAAESIRWSNAPSILPAGAKMALLSGNPLRESAYVLRLKLPGGYMLPAHTQTNDENVTVISGRIHVGMGIKLDQARAETLTAGAFVLIPRDTPHYAWTSAETIIQLHGIGPMNLNYVDQSDDPRRAKVVSD